MSTPQERSTQARIAAHTRWAGEPDRAAATLEARKKSPASIDYWMRKVDPDSLMPYPARLKRAENAKTAYYEKRALKMRQAKARKASGEAA
ncbi:hypothetical protein ACIBEJ_34615 [Nonomuraea sp. NPDC050790]|uniref:hypothetical protein n=1 Tax=Nonomuraea sp. NPDC050790 TaxID=3364371 RepID=UPI00378E9B4C